MSNFAVNDAGDVMVHDGTDWKPAPVAVNDRGEKMAFDGKDWQRLGPAPSLGRQALDAAGDAASAVGDFASRANEYKNTRFAHAMGRVAGIPNTTADAIDWATEKSGIPFSSAPIIGTARDIGRMLPTSADAEKFMTNTLKADPGFTERSINPIVDAGVESLFSGPAKGRLGAPVNFASGATSEGAGELAQKYTPGLEVPARIIGALAGGSSVTALDKLATKTVAGTKAMVRPFTEAGRDDLVGQTLNRQATDAPAAITAMEGYQSPVPGFRLSAGKASRDPGMMGVQEIAEAKTPGMRGVYNDNNSTLTAALDRLDAGMDPKKFVGELAQQDAGAAARAQAALDALPPSADAATAGQAIRDALRGRFEALDTARSRAVEPLYDAVRSSDVPINQWPLMKWTADQVAGTKGPVRDAMSKARDLLSNEDGSFNRVTTAADMDATRKALGSQIGETTDKYTKSLLIEMRGRLDRALSAVPEEGQAIDTFKTMSRPLDVFSADKGYPFNANVIEKAPYGSSNFMLPAERVPSTYFRGGDAGAATMKEFLAANDGNPEALAGMRQFIGGQARDAKDVKAFLQKNRPAIDALDPSLTRQLEDAAATRSISEGFKASPAGKFLGGDLDAAVKSTLGAPDSAKRMQSLRMSVGGNPEAVQGLQKSVLDDFRRSAGSTVAEDAASNPRMTANGAAKWLESNRGAVANVLSPEQVSGLEAITRALKDQAQTIPGRTGSPTFDRLATNSILEAWLSPKLAKSPLLTPVNKMMGLVYSGANEAAMSRLFEVLGDPKATAALMKKATPGNVAMAEPVLARIAAGTGVALSRRDEKGER